MSVIEKFSTISTTITKLFDFLMNSKIEKLNNDVQEYLKTISANNQKGKNLQSVLIPYLFERNIDQKNIFQIYLENVKIQDNTEAEIVKSLQTSFESVFEIKKIMRNGFLFKNLLNDKEYSVLPLVKMTNFRSILAGQFVIARIFEFENTFYLIEISNVYASYQKDDVYRYAIAKLLEKPELLYIDNIEKQKEIESLILEFSTKFKDLFGTDEIISDNKNIDELISLFNDYCEEPNPSLKDKINQFIKEPTEFNFFKVKEFNSQYNNFLENSMGGFSAHNSHYDVGMIFDSNTGLYIIPFWATLKHGFETDYHEIPNYAQCLKSVLENDKIPNTILSRLNSQFPNFMNVVNEILEANYSFEELIQHYKSDFLSQKIYSPTTVLYSSEIFTKTIAMIEKEEEENNKPNKKIRPNDPCPCGSGKKYKKCCGAN